MTTRARLAAVGVVLWAITIAAGSVRAGVSARALTLAVMVAAGVAVAALVIATVRLTRAQQRTGVARRAHTARTTA